MTCSITGIEFRDSSAGFYHDGEWTSWAYINEQLAKQFLRERHQAKKPKAKRAATPASKPNGRAQKLSGMIDRLLADAKLYYQSSGRHLLIYGELGELYAEMRFGITRHKPFTPGSDGKLGNEFVEVKTISPFAKKQRIRVKRCGNFSKLVIVKIAEDFTIDACMVDRKILHKGQGTFATLSWDTAISGK